MADTGWIVATGDGFALLNGGAFISPNDVVSFAQSSTNLKSYYVGSAFPRFIKYFGSAGLASTSDLPDSSTNTIVFYQLTLRYEFQAEAVGWYFIPTGDQVDRLIWNLAPGVTMQFRVYY